MVTSVPDVLTRIRSARDVAFGTYFLGRGPVRDALFEAASHGAHVAVTVQGDPYHDAAGVRERATRDSAALLEAAGARVTVLPSASAPFHLKAAVCDGIAYLDDRNWTRDAREIVLADDDASDVALVRDALAGHGGATPTLATRKDGALAREAELIDSARATPVTVETETLGSGPLSAALRRHARAGAPTVLVVGRAHSHDRRQTTLLEGLRRDGVEVHERGVNEKLALAGDTAWIGSANGTSVFGPRAAQIEWGLVTRERAVVAAVAAALARDAAPTRGGAACSSAARPAVAYAAPA